MKKIISLLMWLLPFLAFAQQNIYKSFPSDYMWMNVGNGGFSSGQALYTSLAFSSSDQPYVAYADGGSSLKATVMRFDGTNWVNVGNAGFSSAEAEYTSLAFSLSDQPYVAFGDQGNSGKATVMMFDGSNWVNVGTAGFSAGMIESVSLAFNPSGQPYVAFGDQGNYGYATVMMFDGSNWVNIGNTGFSAGAVASVSLAFNPSDSQPYVAYEDFGNSQKATVMKFDGTNWVNEGTAGFSAGIAWYTSLAFSPIDNQPYVAFQDFGNNGVSVMKYNGTNWANVGNANLLGGNANYTSLAFSPSGEPYVAYEDLSSFPEGKATVINYNGVTWSTVGSSGFSAGEVNYTSIAFSSTEYEPYVAYEDFVNSQKATVMKYDFAPAGINERKLSFMSIYPNPSVDKITVETSGISGVSNMTIANIEGLQFISCQITKPKTKLDISGLPDGVYFVRLTNDQNVEVEKIVKQ
jgi:hypothetical protein